MAKKLKDYYNRDCAILLGEKIKGSYPSFDLDGFASFIDNRLEDKTFLKRQDLFVDAFEKFMVGGYQQDIAIFTTILGPELVASEGMFTEGWWLWPVGRYVERHGLEDKDITIDFIYELTKRYTGEFAIRALLIDNPREILQLMVKWSKDESVHVRRLASEGMRIRLPWAKKTRAALENPELFIEVLTNLKDDPEKFVLKSVGNNLNDLMKEEPVMAKAIIDKWCEEPLSKSAEWVIRHGERSMRKK